MLNIGGWLFFAVSFLGFYYLWKNEAYSKKVLIAGFFAIFSHHAISGLNVVYGPFFFAQGDAYTFHIYGVQNVTRSAEWAIGALNYQTLLGLVYKMFGASLWLGQAFSVLFFALYCGFFVRIAKQYELNAIFCCLSLLLLGLLPSSLLYGAFTLRETFFTFFFIVGVYFSYIAIYMESSQQSSLKRWIYYAFAVSAFLFMGLLHMVLLVYAIAISAALFLVICSRLMPWKRVMILSLFSFMGVVVLLFLVKNLISVPLNDNYFAMLRVQVNGEVVPIPHAISIYHQVANASGAVTQYDAFLEFKTWGGMIYVFFYSYLFYLGWPITGDYSQVTTWVLMIEALFRIAGIVALCILAKKDKKWLWLLFVYVSITFLWNIGTSNHGQALRHHFMSEWVLVLALMFYLQQSVWVEKSFLAKYLNGASSE